MQKLESISSFSVLGVKTHAINMAEAVHAFETAIAQKQKVYSHALGVAGVMEAHRNSYLREVLNESFLNTPDGMPLVWLGRHFGFRGIERVYGPDLLREVCRYSADKGWRHFFYGAGEGVAPLLKQKMEERFPGIQVVGTYTPPFRDLTEEELAELCRQVDAARPDIFWISLSTPRQIYFMRQQLERINAHVLCAVGYAFDVNAGMKREAPDWMRQSGLQWLHRLFKEPRLWRRYFKDNPAFIFNIACQLLGRTYPAPDKRLTAVVRQADASAPDTNLDLGKFDVLGIGVNAVNYTAAVRNILSAAQSSTPYAVSALAVHGVMTGVMDTEHAKRLNSFDLITPDGQPVRWGLRWLHGVELPDRVYGPTLTLKVCAACAEQGVPVFFYGSTREVLFALAQNLRETFPTLKIAGTEPSKFRTLTAAEEQELVALIRSSGARLTFVGLGCPRQEVFAFHFKKRLSMPLLAVGAAFDFHAGGLAQAPEFLQRHGWEWAYRLYREPRRLWRRYLLLNPYYLWLVLRQVLRNKMQPKV